MKIIFKLLFVVFAVIGFSACKKYNQIDNASTVKTPYTLYVGGYNGVVKKTNDANLFSSIFNTDNSTIRHIVVADSVICYIKDHFYQSVDDGKFFDRTFNTVIKPIDSFYKYYIPNITLYDNINKRLYLCAQGSTIQYSTDLGKTFQTDNNYINGSAPLNAASITQLNNGKLFKMKDTSLYKQIGVAGWDKVIPDTPFNLLFANNWYISHTSDTLMAIDFDGTEGVMYSTDEGKKWYTCKQLPNTQEILFGNQVFGSFYVGLDSAGLYRFSGNKFTSVGKGIPWYAKVSYMVGKTIRYRTDYTRDYYFCATDQGLYVSETGGDDWRLIYPGTWSTLR